MDSLTTRDFDHLASLGISSAEVERQMGLLHHPPGPTPLVRPCIKGDGVLQIQPEVGARLERSWEALVDSARVAKFVPASGAATRMFQCLADGDIEGGSDGSPATSPAAQLLDAAEQFAFFTQLREAAETRGQALDNLIRRGDSTSVVRLLLDSSGLGFNGLAKALIPFHMYPDGSRTALEEHLVEAPGYLVGATEICRCHFTVPENQRDDFIQLVAHRRPTLERRFETRFEVRFSAQARATDTLALDPDGLPLRAANGELRLRPSGHGALIHNLGNLDLDVVYIKNVDNVCHERLHPEIIQWKRWLGGLFWELQQEIFELQSRLESHSLADDELGSYVQMLESRLALRIPDSTRTAPSESLRDYLVQRLNRPLRVCGVVRNEGQPGGGPFWVTHSDGSQSGQIVESAQVDLAASEQRSIWQSSTHFNPVDLVCALRDRHGELYDLETLVDPTTAFVATKVEGTTKLRTLERPGLWNGAMAGWNTVFVEVPLATFAPVKTVFDLLHGAHQPA